MSEPSSFVDSNALPWRPTAYPGVEWKKLRFDPASGESSVLLRFQPGARYGRHRHPGGEQYLVLEGSLEDGGRTWGAGSFVRRAPGSAHGPSLAAGCLLFISLRAPIEDLDGG